MSLMGSGPGDRVGTASSCSRPVKSWSAFVFPLDRALCVTQGSGRPHLPHCCLEDRCCSPGGSEASKDLAHLSPEHRWPGVFLAGTPWPWGSSLGAGGAVVITGRGRSYRAASGQKPVQGSCGGTWKKASSCLEMGQHWGCHRQSCPDPRCLLELSLHPGASSSPEHRRPRRRRCVKKGQQALTRSPRGLTGISATGMQSRACDPPHTGKSVSET